MRYRSKAALKRVFRETVLLPVDAAALDRMVDGIKVRLEMMEPLDELEMGEDDLKGVNP